MIHERDATEHRLPSQTKSIANCARDQWPDAEPQKAHHGSKQQSAVWCGRSHEIPGDADRTQGVQHAQQQQFVVAATGPAKEQTAEHIEATNDAECLGAKHRVHTAQVKVGGQVGG